MAERVLVTGGAGYVGSQAAKALAAAGYVPVVYDDLRRGNRWAVRYGPLVEAPLEDRAALEQAMREHRVTGVMHFAAYAYIGESLADPSLYLRNNVMASLNVLDAMVAAGVGSLIVSSTCAVYGVPPTLPITEATPLDPINTYGATKAMLEEACRWYGAAHGLRTVALRYFNAAGADPDGEIGEWHEPEERIFPRVIAAALGRAEAIRINGTDYPTRDGTAVRDYVHVADLADAHLAAFRRLREGGESAVLNLGTGQGASIREIVEAVAAATGTRPPVEFGPRRPGDPPELVADPARAAAALGWRARRSDIDTIARDGVRWHRDILPGVLARA